MEHPLLYPFNFCSVVFVPLFLFCSFCSAIVVPLYFFRYFCSAIFCSVFFVPLTFLHLHLGSPSPNGRESSPIFVPQFLFCRFCSADLFALALGVAVTQWPRVPTNFCSAIFVPLTFLHLHLGSPSPNG